MGGYVTAKGVVKTPRDEHKWEKAKGISEEAGQKDNYAYIMGIYKKMKPDYEFKTGADVRVAEGKTSREVDARIRIIERAMEKISRPWNVGPLTFEVILEDKLARPGQAEKRKTDILKRRSALVGRPHVYVAIRALLNPANSLGVLSTTVPNMVTFTCTLDGAICLDGRQSAKPFKVDAAVREWSTFAALNITNAYEYARQVEHEKRAPERAKAEAEKLKAEKAEAERLKDEKLKAEAEQRRQKEEAPGKQNPRPQKFFKQWIVVFDHPRKGHFIWTYLGGLKPAIRNDRPMTFDSRQEAEKVASEVADYIVQWKPKEFEQHILGWVRPGARSGADVRVAAAWLVKMAGPRDLQDALKALDALDALSLSIGEVTDAFEMHYRMAAAIPTSVSSQLDALKKARAGRDKASTVFDLVDGVLTLYPTDKTALRAAKDAAVMVKRFQKHADDATKMIRTLSKKAMPPALKKMAASVATSIKRQLTDPKVLQVIPWTGSDASYQRGEVVQGMAFQMTFRIADKQLSQGMANTMIQESTIRTIGPFLAKGYGGDPKTTTSKEVVAHFISQLKGYSGLQGEGGRTEERMDRANEIARVVTSLGKAWGRGEVDRTEVPKGGLNVYGGFRADTRWESESDDDYDQGVQREAARYGKELSTRLSPWKAHIQGASVHYNEKGWWSISVDLK